MHQAGYESFAENQLYRQMFQQAPGALGIIDTSGHWVDANGALCRMFGYSKQELYGRRCDELPESGYPDEAVFQFEHALRRKLDRHDSEKVCIHKLGFAVRVSFTMSLIRDVHGLPQWFLVEYKPVADMKEGDLHRTSQLYRAASDSISDALAVIDPDGVVLEVNAAYTRVFGWRSGEVVGRRLPVTPKGHEQQAQQLFEAIRDGARISGFEAIKQHKDGSLIEVSISMVPIYDKSGKLVETVTIAKDLTLQNKLWKLARESEENLSNLVEHTPEPLLIFRGDRCIYANASGLRMFGASGMNGIVSRTAAQLGQPDSAALMEGRLSLAAQGLMNGPAELQLCRIDGTSFDAEAIFVPATLGGEICTQVVIRDMTEQKQTQEAYRLSDKMKAVGQMAAGLAHEIRNPLTAIKGFVQLAEWQLPNKSEYFTIIKSEIERIDSITSEMLMLARPNPNKMKVTDLRSILKSVSSLLETQAIISNIEIASRLTDEPCPVLCDENQIKQVFVNLIKNAVEAMKSGGTITVSTEIDDAGTVVAEVRDEGCGIPEEQLAKLGQPFNTTKEKGTGLGLMVSYKIIENHRGEIVVSSEENVGTVIRVCLPLAL